MEMHPDRSLISIRDLKQQAGAASQHFVLHAQLSAVQVKPTRQGSEFAEVKFADAGDSFTLRVWGDAPQFSMVQRLQPPCFMQIEGDWTASQYGVESRNWKLRPLEEVEIAELLIGPAGLREKQQQDFADINALVASLADPRLRGLAELFLQDYGERFRRAGAAREYHHARRGGLVEHVAQMMRSANVLAQVYPRTNRDLLLTGVLFHDSGKLWENCYAADGFSMPHSLPGEMLGHITLGIELVNKLWRKLLEGESASGWLALSPPNEEVRLHLLHLIAAHHGEYQFGSPVLPKSPEAILLHHVDNIDAKLEMMYTAYQTSAQLGRQIYERMRPLPANLVEPLEHFAAPIAPEEGLVE